tara:strand:+ start:237 stop:416 length:180 start_codon:yes stop_codon:yes gene_type:complete
VKYIKQNINFIEDSIIKLKIDTVFSVSGGGSMFLINAFGKNKKFKKITKKSILIRNQNF